MHTHLTTDLFLFTNTIWMQLQLQNRIKGEREIFLMLQGSSTGHIGYSGAEKEKNWKGIHMARWDLNSRPSSILHSAAHRSLVRSNPTQPGSTRPQQGGPACTSCGKTQLGNSPAWQQRCYSRRVHRRSVAGAAHRPAIHSGEVLHESKIQYKSLKKAKSKLLIVFMGHFWKCSKWEKFKRLVPLYRTLKPHGSILHNNTQCKTKLTMWDFGFGFCFEPQ